MTDESTEVVSAASVQSVVFALHILEFMARQKEAIGVTEMAVAFETSKSRMFRHLRTLLQQGYIVQDGAGRYKIGTRLVALGNAVMQNFDLFQLSAAVMRELRDKIGSSTVLCQMGEEGLRVLSVVPGKAQIEITVKSGSLMGYHCSAQGKLALAYGSPELRTRVLSKPLEARSPKTIVSVEKLEEELKQIKKRGWATAPEESVTGLNAVAAPLFDATGTFIGTLAVVDSVQFLPKDPSQELINDLIAAAKTVSANLGYSPGS